MKRPFKDKRPIGPFNVTRSKCTLKFQVTYGTDGKLNIDENEVSDELQRSLPRELKVDRVFIKDTSVPGHDNGVLVKVVTDLGSIHSSNEDVMIREIKKKIEVESGRDLEVIEYKFRAS